MKKKIKSSINIALSQYHNLYNLSIAAKDEAEKTVLKRRLLNLLGVINFLISIQEVNSNMGPFL